ncbi:MAG TPA: hypothetical protein VF384_19095 [Planctomycetota bacterium]
MKSRVLLLLLPLLLGGISVWLVQSADDPAVPDHIAAAAAPGPAAATAAEATAVEATSQPTAIDPVRAAVAAATGQSVPFPDDAVWTEVRVVDKATGEPVPDATVTWSDQTTEERVNKDATLGQDDRRWLQRDQEQINAKYGWHAVSDASGHVRVHVTEQTLVLARRETRYGTLRLQKNTIPPRDGYRLEIEPDIEVLVKVLDSHGQPAAGVPIGVTQNDAQGKVLQLWRWQAQAITRAPDGIAALRHLQELRAEHRADKFAEWRARTYLPGHDDPGVAFQVETPAAEPVVLRLPPCGGVRVRAEMHGATLTAVKTIMLAENSREQGGMNWMMRRATHSRSVDDQGWAFFEHVPLGRSYRASASVMSGYLSSELKGPMTEDAVVTVVLSIGDQQMMLTGRLLDEQRAVLADQEFSLLVRAPYNENNTSFRTDANGRFLLFLGQWDKDTKHLQRVSIVSRPPASMLQADLTKRELRAGVQDAGDVVMQPGQLVVAGRLVSGDGPCTLKLQPAVERHEVPENAREARWQRQRDFQFHRDDNGHFEFRGDAQPGRYRLTLTSSSHLPVEPIEFTLGTKDLVVNVDTGAPLAASVLLPKDAPQGLRAVLVRDGEPATVDAATWRQGYNRLAAYPWSREPERYQLQWGSIAPGTYTLLLQLWCDPEPLATIGNVQVPAPKDRDARLVDIDLRSSVRIATVCLFDQNGQPIESYNGALFPIGQDPAKTWLGYDAHGEKASILVRTAPLELIVAKRGFRPRQVQCAAPTTEVKLDPWPTVELAFDGLQELPKETTLMVRFAPRDPSAARYRTMSNSGDRNDVMAAPRSSVAVAEGRAKVPIGEGPHDLMASVSRKRRTVAVDLPKGEPVFSNSPSLHVSVPGPALQKALDQLTAQETEKK